MTTTVQKVTRNPDDDAIHRHFVDKRLRLPCFDNRSLQFNNWWDTLMMVDCLLKSTPDGIVNRQHSLSTFVHGWMNEKAQLSLTNPRDAISCQNCSNSTCLQRCRWQYWSIFIRLAVVASEICEIRRNSLKIQTYRVQGHPRSSILVSIESAYASSYSS